MDYRNEFSLRLKWLRKNSGYKPKEFAEKLNIRLQTYYVYERGQNVPSFDVLIGIAEKCDVSLDWLCGITPFEETSQITEATTVLSQLLKASKSGDKFEVRFQYIGSDS